VNIKVLAVSLVSVSIATVACGAGEDPPAVPSPAESSSQGMGGMDHGESFAFGEPADPSQAERIIQVEALDSLRFDPSSIEVDVGETVTFEVTNAGETAHEFVLGDATTQDEHQGEMGNMGASMMPDEKNVLGLDRAEESSLTWTFTEPGTVLYACHVEDHFAGGMVGAITVGNG
jgi:uncharacterized cupredoxin-like copper-binding protein